MKIYFQFFDVFYMQLWQPTFLEITKTLKTRSQDYSKKKGRLHNREQLEIRVEHVRLITRMVRYKCTLAKYSL